MDDGGTLYRYRSDGTLKPAAIRVNDMGYYILDVNIGNRTFTMRAHRIVCAAFHGGPPGPGLDVRHMDACRTNNHPSNLQWGTRKENIADMMLRGDQWLQKNPDGFTPEMRRNMSTSRVAMLESRPELVRKGSRHHGAKLIESDVVEIRRRKCAGESIRRISKDYPVCMATIYAICSRTIWKHVKDEAA